MKHNTPAYLIVANGDAVDIDWLREMAQSSPYVVAADGGANHLHSVGVLPNSVVGDLDSVDSAVMSWMKDGGVSIEAFSAEKDHTDLELALDAATRHGATSIDIAAAWGGRADQTMANLLLLAKADLLPLDIRLIRPYEQIFVTESGATLNGHSGATLSLIPLTQDVVIADTVGLKWPLHDSKLQFGHARGVSNVITAEKASFSIASGIVACFVLSADWDR